jgi:hypothetical protein
MYLGRKNMPNGTWLKIDFSEFGGGDAVEKFIPHPYQRYCIHRVVTEPVLGLFLDMGLG